MAEHQVLSNIEEAAWSRVVPPGLHSDAGPYGKKASCVVISFSSLVGIGEEKLCPFPIAAYIELPLGEQDVHTYLTLFASKAFCISIIFLIQKFFANRSS